MIAWMLLYKLIVLVQCGWSLLVVGCWLWVTYRLIDIDTKFGENSLSHTHRHTDHLEFIEIAIAFVFASGVELSIERSMIVGFDGHHSHRCFMCLVPCAVCICWSVFKFTFILRNNMDFHNGLLRNETKWNERRQWNGKRWKKGSPRLYI